MRIKQSPAFEFSHLVLAVRTPVRHILARINTEWYKATPANTTKRLKEAN